MALSTYAPDSNSIVHCVTVDIGNVRPMSSIVKLSQGDKSLPVIAVKITNSGNEYSVPDNADGIFEMIKGDGKAVRNSLLGVSPDRHTVYVSCTEQTCAVAGRGTAMIQINVGESVAGTASFYIDVQRRPTDGANMSKSEIGYLDTLLSRAENAAEDAINAANEAQSNEDQTVTNLNSAKDAANKAQQSASNAQTYSFTAQQFSTNASNSAMQASLSATQADTSATDAAASAQEAKDAATAVKQEFFYSLENGRLYFNHIDTEGE